MAIKVMLKRVPKPGKWRELNEILIELRMLGMGHRGYISGETLLSATDQGTNFRLKINLFVRWPYGG